MLQGEVGAMSTEVSEFVRPDTLTLMRETVALGVALERQRYAALTDDQRDHAIAQARADEGRMRADDAMYNGSHAAEGMRSLIRTLAALSLAEGGVTWQGLHWCPDHGRCVEAGVAS